MKKKTLALIALSLFLIFPQAALAATLSLSPASGTFNSGCNFSLDVILDTSGVQTDGTDAILIYDSAKFSATSISKGTIYEDYPGTNIDDVGGKVTISGLASVSSAFNGKGSFATLNFAVKSGATAGATKIRFDFDANDKTKTTDSNVVERGTVEDVLSSVVDGNYIIGSGSCVASSPAPGQGAVGVGSTAPSVTPEPNLDCLVNELRDANGNCVPEGIVEITYGLALIGSILTIVGILGLALL